LLLLATNTLATKFVPLLTRPTNFIPIPTHIYKYLSPLHPLLHRFNLVPPTHNKLFPLLLVHMSIDIYSIHIADY